MGFLGILSIIAQHFSRALRTSDTHWARLGDVSPLFSTIVCVERMEDKKHANQQYPDLSICSHIYYIEIRW